NLPDSRNPISDSAMVEALCDRVDAVNADPDVRAVVLTGAGTAFSAGGNVKDMVERNGMFGGSPYGLRDGYRRGIQRIPRALYHCEGPVIAAGDGPAVGAGCDPAVMCGLRGASTRACFAERRGRLASTAGAAGAWRLTKAIGPARAAEVALAGARVTAEQALEWGLVNQVAGPDALLAAARALAGRVAKNPPHSVRMAKKLLRESQHQSLESLLELSAAMQALAHHTEDHREALAAFGEKRAGDYTGR